MRITESIMNRLYEEDTQVDTDRLSQDLFNRYYNKENNSFKNGLEFVISDRCNDDETLINEVKAKLDSLVKEYQETNKPEKVEDKSNTLSPELKETGEKIVKILNNYGVKAELSNAKVGPSITQYELQLAPGTKISEVTNLSKEIAMGLAVKSVSINPVEGDTTLGIQVPNKESTNVKLDDVMNNSEKQGVSVALGKDTNGNAVSGDILKLQHVLIGGTTGSGKSACINSMICSLIQQYSPDQVKLVLIDPKKVELTSYRSIPHLLMPIVTDPQKAAEVLNQLCEVMDDRYSSFEKVRVKDIESYNKLVEKYNATGNNAKLMPYIVVIIDELADLMQTAGKSVESSIQRLTQLARAAGIHLIVATQRPSTDVVTGVIKSNINSRIAFSTASNVDSRVILDQPGAEKLLGKGDMLYKPIGSQNATRLQGAYVSDDEVEDIVRNVENTYGTNSNNDNETVQQTDSKENTEESKVSDNYQKAIEIVKKNRRISASMLQLQLHIPYSEASEIIKKMENDGIIKPQSGNKMRKVDRKKAKEA